MWYFDGTYPPLIIKILLFLGSTLVVWFIGFLFKKNLDRVSRRKNFEAKNSLKLLATIAQIFAIAILFTLIFQIESSAILSVSALLGTTIGFATSVVVGNIVAGLYLIAVRPFGIGDLILVKGTEGIVMEIGLNYTKLLTMDESYVLIPNKSLLDANLINCSIKISNLKERASMGHEIGYQTLMEDLGELNPKSKKLTKEFVDELLGGRDIVRYPFTLQLKLNIVSPDITLVNVNKRMNTVMKRWAKKLGFQPRFFFNKYVFRQDMRIILIFDHPQQILEIFEEFVEDLYQTVFLELHQKEVN
ncbi:MAG: mechanosensitive ion channel [Candidatus Heimdallarchaeota archaeon]|nr:mechanosensitive ion channel [Candidatus Heimdallarchaeota archaeon]